MHKGAEWGIKQKKKNHKREAAINESGVNDVSFFLFFFLPPCRPPRGGLFGRGAIAKGPVAGQGPSGAPNSAIILRTVATGMFPAPLPKNVLVHERARACGCVFFFSSFFVMCLYVGALALASARHARTARVAPVVCFHRNPSLSCGGGGERTAN